MASRIEMLQAKIAKLKGTLARHEARRARKQKALNVEQDKDARFWLAFDIDAAEEDINRTLHRIVEARTALNKAIKEQEAAKAAENALPRQLKSFRDQIVESWTSWDIAERDKSDAKPNCWGWRTDEQLREANFKAASRLVASFLQRVEKVAGRAVDFTGLSVANGNSMEGAAINGLVAGDRGVALVQTIAAGGWNIQRFHYRVLVNKKK